jgi:uncharacterized protein with von Willebrand factor type A (vWA) domain
VTRPPFLPVDVVVRHPALRDLGRDEPDQRRAESFAIDLARWLYGRPREELRPLARVVTVVAQRELRPTRLICRERPLMSVEAAARATVALWPLLRDESDAPPHEHPPDAPEEQEGGQEETTDESDPLASLLGELGQEDDPDLDALMGRLREAMGASPTGDAGAAEDVAHVLDEVSAAAADGAIATDQVARHLERFLPGIGWSTAPGQLEVTMLERLDQLTALLAELPGLGELADALGRLEGATDREGIRQGGREELVGVRLGGEVAYALPTELALLGDEDTEDLFFQRLLEKRLVSLELTGIGDEGRAAGDHRGPVIACIDTSASMEGPPELCAKALVLAVCRHVIPKGRVVHLILFGGPGERTEIRLRRGLGGLEGMLAFLQQSFHSGTDFDGPLLRAMDLLEEQGLAAADVLVVTDGLCRAGPDVIERVQETRARVGVRVWSVVLGHRDTRGVEPFSDEVLQIDPTASAGAARALRSIAGSRRI